MCYFFFVFLLVSLHFWETIALVFLNECYVLFVQKHFCSGKPIKRRSRRVNEEFICMEKQKTKEIMKWLECHDSDCLYWARLFDSIHLRVYIYRNLTCFFFLSFRTIFPVYDYVVIFPRILSFISELLVFFLLFLTLHTLIYTLQFRLPHSFFQKFTNIL